MMLTDTMQALGHRNSLRQLLRAWWYCGLKNSETLASSHFLVNFSFNNYTCIFWKKNENYISG